MTHVWWLETWEHGAWARVALSETTDEARARRDYERLCCRGPETAAHVLVRVQPRQYRLCRAPYEVVAESAP